MPEGVAVHGPKPTAIADDVDLIRFEEILTEPALAFVADLHRRFEHRRRRLIADRTARQQRLDAGETPGFLSETEEVRMGTWKVAPHAHDLTDRRCEITGPVDRKMMINALNSGAKVFMADLEDSASPTWHNMVMGQVNLMDAVRRRIEVSAADGRIYRLGDEVATLVVRPRGWHLVDRHLTVDGEAVSASLLDFGLYFFHNAAELTAGGSGPYFYLPKLENRLEARLWNEVFVTAQDALGIPQGTIRATVLIETILAAFEMDEILYELRHHSSGLNAGRWDYIFSMIKKFRNRPEMTLPDRGQVTMTVPFMRAYTDLLIATCHARGAHAIGGMSAFIPSRRNPEVNRTAMAKVREDKERESRNGHDGTWVAHPDLVPVATEVFTAVLGDRPHQIDVLRHDVVADAAALLDVTVPGATVTSEGVRSNVDIAIRYLVSWLSGNGAAAIYNLMEDAATAEISRSQIWQWVHNGVSTTDGDRIDADYVRTVAAGESERLAGELAGGDHGDRDHGPADLVERARALFETVALADDFPEFLTLPAYDELEG